MARMDGAESAHDERTGSGRRGDGPETGGNRFPACGAAHRSGGADLFCEELKVSPNYRTMCELDGLGCGPTPCANCGLGDLLDPSTWGPSDWLVAVGAGYLAWKLYKGGK